MIEEPKPNRFRPIIRVFVSSTFSDLVAERNTLADRVWPELERHCQLQGFQFQAIDLRWGVSTEAGLDHRTMRICFEELRRSQIISPQPNFLILLGDRYGWQPLPEQITPDEYGRPCCCRRGSESARPTENLVSAGYESTACRSSSPVSSRVARRFGLHEGCRAPRCGDVDRRAVGPLVCHQSSVSR